jgi:hypothetical protein
MASLSRFSLSRRAGSAEIVGSAANQQAAAVRNLRHKHSPGLDRVLFPGNDRIARFLIDKSPLADQFLAMLDRGASRPATPYGRTGW